MASKINTNKERVLALEKKMKELELDLVMVFATVHDFAYGQFFCGFKPALYHYFFIRKLKSGRYEEGFLIPDFMEDLLDVPKGFKVHTFNDQKIPVFIRDFVGKTARFGLLGPAPVEHFSKIGADIIFMHNQIWPLLNEKTPQEIKKITEASQILEKNLEKIGHKIRAGALIEELAEETDRIVLDLADALAFPSIIMGNFGKRNFMHSLGMGKKIGATDTVWVNLGIEKDGFMADRGKMFFVGNDHLKKDYQLFQRVIAEFVAGLLPGMKTADLSSHLYRLMIKAGLTKYKLKEAYLGHNIGFSLFEEPLIGHGLFVDATLKNNMTISLSLEITRGKVALKIQEMAVIMTKGGKLI